MPRSGSYVNNASNRSLGRVGMSYGTAVNSSAGSSSSNSYSSPGGYGSSTSYSSSSRTYVDNSMNRSLGRVGQEVGTAVHSRESSYASSPDASYGSRSSTSESTSSSRTYVDNSMNRSLGRVGMEVGTAVHSKEYSSPTSGDGGSSSTAKTYVDNSTNRVLGRVGAPLGSAVHSSSSLGGSISQSGIQTSSAGHVSKCYVDNAYNRRLGRVGLPLGSVVQGSTSTASSSSSPTIRRYVDNQLNRRLGRVGKAVGSCPISKGNVSREIDNTGDDAHRVYGPLRRLDPEDDDLYAILKRLDKFQRDQEDPSIKAQCEKAKGVIYRHDATRALYEAGLKKPEWLKGGEIIDFKDLDLGNKLGGGGFGDVFAAIWKGNLQVAVKKLRVQRVPEKKKEQFLQEVKMFSNLQHPGIVEFYGACTITPDLAIVMEFMEQGSLYDILHVEEQKLSLKQKRQMMQDMLSAVAYIHDKKIAHRDMKSMNILVSDDFEHCKVGDFGLALKDESRSSSSVADYSVVGTLLYSPPEVLVGERLTFEGLTKADVYSTAIVIVELLTAQIPYEGLNQHQVRRAILQGERPSFKSKKGSKVGHDLQKLLEKGFHKHPAERPSASLMNEEFLGLLLEEED